MSKKQPFVTIVGAGPGDPDLMTIKGMKALSIADVVLYDALANPALLEHATNAVKKLCVGKRAGKHSYKQEEIQMLMVRCAHEYGHVVRLKGGDPFVFGRGHEEIDFLKAFDIPTAVIPGISSALAVPASQGIPVTCRGVAESFWVVTATTRQGKLSNDLTLAARSTATIVILMGMRKLKQIIQIFESAGKAHIPAMIVQNGTLPEEKCVVTTIKNLATAAETQELGTPALIVIGETVRAHPAFVQSVKSAVA
jgi:uroporphyrin-III C-methyltransferase